MIRNEVETAQSGSFPTDAIERLQTLVNLSNTEKRAATPDWLLVLSARALNKPERYNLPDSDVQICANRAKDWVNGMREVLAATDRELSEPGRRDLSKTPAGIARKDWEDKYAKKKDELATAVARQKFVLSLSARGADIELSELLDTRDSIRRDLFGNGNDTAFFGLTHVSGPAESWLEYKWRSTGVQLKDYDQIMPLMRQTWLDRHVVKFTDDKQKEFACSYAENAVMTLSTAAKDIEAGRLFCTTFDQTINSATHPFVTAYCLGKFDDDGTQTEIGWIAAREREVKTRTPELDKILAWGVDAGCTIPTPLQSLP